MDRVRPEVQRHRWQHNRGLSSTVATGAGSNQTLTEHGVTRALERLDQIQDLVDILRTGDGYYDPLTDTNIVYSNKYKQGVVLDRKTGKIITVLSKAPKSQRWISVGRAAINAILKK